MGWDLFDWAQKEISKAIWGENKGGQRTQQTQEKKDHNTNIVQDQRQYSGGSSSGGGNSGQANSGGASSGGAVGTDLGATTDTKPKSSMSEEEVKYFDNMKDSNVPYYYDHDENDLMYLAASEKKDYYWGLKEEVFVYTMHDRQKHRYITSFQIDSDAEDIVTTCTINMPYKNELMEYYIPGRTVFMLIGGTFDREVLFVGRVSEVNQYGQAIEVVGQNIGWKFKQYMSQEFFDKIQGQPIKTVVKAILKELGFEKGKYLIDLWAIPNIDKYQIDENGGVTNDGESVDEVPDLDEVVSRLKDADINKYVAKKARVLETQEVADTYEESLKMRDLNYVVGAKNSYYSHGIRKNYGIKTSIEDEEVNYTPLEDRLLGTDKNFEYFTEDKSGDSDFTYETILSNIAAAIDAQFFIVDTTVCFISFNSLMAMSKSEAIVKSIQPTINFWQLQEDTYELEVNQYGYYNTVIIKYKNGELKRAYDDLVRVYGEVPITYEEPDLDYEGAQLKAQAYLAAHVRDFGMQVRATILYTGKITVASFIKMRNPLTMSETLLYVYGISVQWDAKGQTITCDLDLRYGPENPNPPEVPEYGMGYDASAGTGDSSAVYGGDVSANIEQAAQQMIQGATNPTDKAYRIYNWVDKNVVYEKYYGPKYSSEQVLSGKRANCWDTAYLIYKLCSSVGVKCEVHNGTYHFLDGNWGHLWNKIEINGQMVFADTGRQSQNPIGEHGVGRYIVSDSCVAKNY